MKKNSQQFDGIGEQLRNYELTPSDRVWQGIDEAAPSPLPSPFRPKIWVYGAAAILFVAASLVLYQMYFAPSSDMEQLEVMVPKVAENQSPLNGSTPTPKSDLDNYEKPMTDEDTVKTHRDTNTTPNPPANASRQTAPVTQPGSTNNGRISEPTPPVRTEPRPVEMPPVIPEVTTAPRPVVTPTPDEPMVQPVDQPVEETVLPEDLVKWEVPNAFVPNFDGVNDYFKPVVLNQAEVTDFKMQIYTRSGNLLFESNHIDNGWDGRHNGAMVPPQVYIWAISFRDMHGKPYARRGYVTLIR
jgi:gliding motility-associated-like protein